MQIYFEIQKELKKSIKQNVGLRICLPESLDYFKPLEIISENAAEGYLFSSVVSDEYTNIRDTISEQPDRYDRRKLKMDSLNFKEYSSYWKDIGGGSTERIVMYFEYDEKILEKIFKLCSPAELMLGGGSLSGMEQMKRKSKKKTNTIGVFVNTCDNNLIFDAYIDIKLELYDMSQKYGNIHLEDYKKNLLARGLLYGIPPLPNIENAKKLLANLKS